MHIPDWRSAPLTLSCQPVGGMHARDQRAGNYSQGLKHTDRTTATQRPGIRVRTDVSVTGGYVAAAHPHRKTSKNARRKARRYGK